MTGHSSVLLKSRYLGTQTRTQTERWAARAKERTGRNVQVDGFGERASDAMPRRTRAAPVITIEGYFLTALMMHSDDAYLSRV